MTERKKILIAKKINELMEHVTSDDINIHETVSSKSQPCDPTLYNMVKLAAQQKFKSAWPSIGASLWLVREYKSLGGKFFGKKKASRLLAKIQSNPLISYWPDKEMVITHKAPLCVCSYAVHFN